MIKEMDAVEATNIARAYLKPFAAFTPVSCHKKGSMWWVQVNVGSLYVKIIELEIDPESREIVRAR